jgi:V-type H+-transporting ATPase subunit A
LTQGDIIGSVYENSLFNEHNILVPPKCKGRVTFLAEPGEYNIKHEILKLELDGKEESYSMSHYWPVRQPRPIHEKLGGDVPLLTGCRVLDAMFPCVLGGTCAIPGYGKSCISQGIAKYSNS